MIGLKSSQSKKYFNFLHLLNPNKIFSTKKNCLIYLSTMLNSFNLHVISLFIGKKYFHSKTWRIMNSLQSQDTRVETFTFILHLVYPIEPYPQKRHNFPNTNSIDVSTLFFSVNKVKDKSFQQVEQSQICLKA